MAGVIICLIRIIGIPTKSVDAPDRTWLSYIRALGSCGPQSSDFIQLCILLFAVWDLAFTV